CDQLALGLGQDKPARTIDLRELSLFATVRRPLDAEAVTAQLRRIQVRRLHRPGEHLFAARLPNRWQCNEAPREWQAGLLLKRPARGGERLFLRRVLALRYRPCALILCRPVGPAGVHEEHLQQVVSPAIGENSSTVL